MNFTYLDAVRGILDRIQNEQGGALKEISSLCARAIAGDHLLYFFGTGHSHMVCEEPFYRAGGLAPVYPLLLAPLMLHDNASMSTDLERVSGIADVLLADSGISPGDILFLISNSGRNSAIVDAALWAKANGIKSVAITSLSHSRSVQSRHASGKRLFELCDYVLDNCGEPGDACVSIGGSEHKVGPTSTIADVALINLLIVNAVEQLVREGREAPVFKSSNTDEGDAYNEKILSVYRKRIKML